MATIKIKRSNDYINRMREYRLFIDGRQVGTIANNQIEEIDVTPGQHSIIARIDWCSSPELSFETNETDTKVIMVGGIRNVRWLLPLCSMLLIIALLLKNVSIFITAALVLIPFLYLLFYFTIGRKKYLTIKELNKS